VKDSYYTSARSWSILKLNEFPRQMRRKDESMKKAKAEVVFQVGMVVRDAEAKVAALVRCFDIDESTIVRKNTKDMAEAGSFSDCRYLGRPAEFYIKTIRLSFGGIDFEYVEPLNKDGGDPFSNWLLEHGEGIHHINVKFADNGVLRENLTELGIPELHSAKMRDKGYAFYDLRETFGFLAEVGEMVVGPMAEAYYAGKEHP